MIYLPVSIGCSVGGAALLALTYLFPVTRAMYLDWCALILMAVPSILFIYGMSDRKVTWLMEKVPKGKMLILFMRRDGDIVPVLGTRAYPGESFIDVPNLGLIHDLGNVHRWGANNVRFALENVNHTIDPRYANFTAWLYDKGFNNIKELKATLTGKFPEKVKEVIEKIDEDKSTVETMVDELAATDRVFPHVESEK